MCVCVDVRRGVDCCYSNNNRDIVSNIVHGTTIVSVIDLFLLQLCVCVWMCDVVWIAVRITGI